MARFHSIGLTAAPDGVWRGPLPPGLAGQWCLVRLPGLPRGTPARLLLADATRGHVVREAWLGRAGGTLLHVPQGARELGLAPFGTPGALSDAARALNGAPTEAPAGTPTGAMIGVPGAAGEAVALMRAVPRAVVAARLGVLGAASLPGALRGSPQGLAGRVRAMLGRAGRAPAPDYAAWVRQFDTWGAADRARLEALPGPAIRVLVAAGAAGAADALAATLRSLEGQWRAPAAVTVAADASALLDGLLARLPGVFVALLAAGEVLPPHALALIGSRLGGARVDGPGPGGAGRGEPRPDRAPDVVHADWDRLGAAGRMEPCFLPGGGDRLLLTGLPARGPCLFRCESLAAPTALAGPGLCGAIAGVMAHGGSLQAAAEPLRLAVWLALRRAGRDAALHLPFVLAHRRLDAAEPDLEALAGPVRAHLAACRMPAALPCPVPPLARARTGPRNGAPPSASRTLLRPRWRARAEGSVSVVVASACRSAHVVRCLRRLLRVTAEPHALEVLVAVSAIDPADRRQAAVLARVRALPHTRVLALDLPAFNYARVNNLAVAEARHATVLLLNDDVAPIRPDWLSVMRAHLEDPAVGAVGARLLYGNARVQHGGVVLGLGGLAEHADRLRPASDPGPLGLGGVDREVSAVTAACLLLRRAEWQALGGMDERFAVALNDVDLCLRLRARGRLVVQANTAVLHHYESLSLGRHYAGGRAALEAVEVGLLRRLWGPELAADPYYNPNLSLEAGREWTPAWPPRVVR